MQQMEQQNDGMVAVGFAPAAAPIASSRIREVRRARIPFHGSYPEDIEGQNATEALDEVHKLSTES